MTDVEFLESMSKSDELVDHLDNCGLCAHQIIMAECARKMLAEADTENGIHKWAERTRQMWEETKYFKLYQQELAAGRNPAKAFEERGWEM